LSKRKLLSRRPSPAIAISSVALFLSLGGVGYAATSLPANSVGSYQLRPGAVTYTKIQPGAVGNVRANVRQLQERVWKSCPANTAIAHVARNGDPTCSPTLPAEFGTTDNTVHAVGATPATVTQVALPVGASYLAMANPQATVTPAATVTASQHTTVTCKLTVGSDSETRSVTIDTTGGQSETASIPLQLTGGTGTGAVSCTSATAPVTGATTQPTAPSVDVTSTVSALQIASASNG
jgi:hypothetical protein